MSTVYLVVDINQMKYKEAEDVAYLLGGKMDK